MMDPGVIGALIAVVITSMLAPMVMGWVKGKAEHDAIVRAASQAEEARVRAKVEHDQEAADRRADKEQDWARQDLVASRAAAAAEHLEVSQALLADQATTAATLLAANTVTVAAQLNVLDDGQKIIHGLVNSTLTASMQADLEGKRLLLLALKRNSQLEPDVTQDSKDLILITEAKIYGLEANLAERAEQQKVVDARIQKQSDDRAEV